MKTSYRLRPSESSRWLNCSGYARAVIGIPRETSVYAEEGTNAHAELESSLRFDIPPEQLSGVDEELASNIRHVYEWLVQKRTEHPVVLVEHRVEIPELAGVSDGGTIDLGIVSVDRVTVLDYKHGAGVFVDAEDNTQLMLYHLGLRAQYGKREVYENVIVQPRHRESTVPIRSWEFSNEDLNAFSDRVKAAIVAAHDPEAKRCAGKWCRFCPAASRCYELAAHAFRTVDPAWVNPESPILPQEISDEQLSYVLDRLDVINTWANAIRARALELLKAGATIPNWKLAFGRTRRLWRAEEKEIISELTALGFSEDQILTTSLISVAQAEKLFKHAKRKADFASLERFIGWSLPKVVLARADDPRPQLNQEGDSTWQEEM